MNPFEEIQALLRTYLDGLHHSDTDSLRRVFHPSAVYATADESPLLIRDMDEYMAIVAKRPSPASRGEPRLDAIESIELAGRNTALARVRCSIGRRDFIDFLSLVRENGRWRILSKVFAFTENPGD